MKKRIKILIRKYAKLVAKKNDVILLWFTCFFIFKALISASINYITIDTVVYSKVMMCLTVLEVIGILIALLTFPTMFMIRFTDFAKEWKNNKHTFLMVIMLSFMIVFGSYIGEQLLTKIDSTVARTQFGRYICAYNPDEDIEDLKSKKVEHKSSTLSIYKKSGDSYVKIYDFENKLRPNETFDVIIKKKDKKYIFDFKTYVSKKDFTVTREEFTELPIK